MILCLPFSACQVVKDKKALKLNELFADHMVLQRNKEAVFWGNYTPKEKVTVSGSWEKEASIIVDYKGNWTLNLPTPEAGGPFTINIITNDSIILLTDVMIGEVWLASGQSNMEMPLKGWPPNDIIKKSEEEISKANYQDIRMFTVERQFSIEPLDTLKEMWQVANPGTAGNFSATAYFFARRLYKELNVPIGSNKFLELCKARIDKKINNTSDFLTLIKNIGGKEIAHWFEQSLKTK